MADLPSYLKASSRADLDYQQHAVWANKAILNVARTGFFSSDRTIREYARDIWHIKSSLGPHEEPAAAPATRESVSAEA
jgi:starch phosphorylase